MEVLHGVLRRNGLKIQDVNSNLTITTIIKDTAKTFSLPRSYLTWQMCSAAAHGRPWARQHLTLFDVHDDDGSSKTLGGQLSSNELAMATSLRTACEVFEKALMLRQTYSKNPERPGNSFMKPPRGLHIVKPRLIVPWD